MTRHERDKKRRAFIEAVTKAIHPVIFPVEQQDMAIQAANWETSKKAAKGVWRSINRKDA